MECESMLFVKNHIPHLWDLSNSFSNSFIDCYSCEVVSWSDMTKNEVLSFDRFISIMVVVFKLWIYFMQVVAKCLHFVMSYMRQTKKHKQTLESVQYGLEISLMKNSDLWDPVVSVTKDNFYAMLWGFISSKTLQVFLWTRLKVHALSTLASSPSMFI